MYSLFCTTFTGYQSTQGQTTRFQPCASTLSPILLLSTLLSFYLSTPLPVTSIHPKTHAPSVFLLSKLSHLVKEHSLSQAQLNGIYCLVISCLHRSASVCLHPFQTPPFILGHTHSAYSFHQNYVIWSKSILLHRPNSMEFTDVWTPTL